MSDHAPPSSLHNLPRSGAARGSASTVSGDGDVYIRPDGKKVRRIVKRVARPKSVVNGGGSGNNNNTSEAAMNLLRSGMSTTNSTATTTTTTSNSSVNSTPPRQTAAAAPDNNTTTATTTSSSRPKTLGGFLDLVGGGKKKGMGSKSVAGDFAKPKMGFFSSAQSLAPKPAAVTPTSSAADTANNNSSEEHEIFIRPDGKKVRRIKRTIVKSRSGRDLMALQDAANSMAADDDNDAGDDNDNPAPAQADGLGSLLSSVNAQDSVIKKRTSAATVTGAPLSQSAAAGSGIGEIYINAQGKKVRRVIKRPSGPQKTQSTSGLADMQQAVSAAANVTPNAIAGAATATPEYEVYRRADGKLVRRLKKSGAASLDNMLASGPAATKTGAATVGGERVLGPGQEIREEVEIYIRPDGKKVRRVKKVIVKKKDASATVVSDESASASEPSPPPASTSQQPTMTTKAELDALLEASASKPPPRTGAASVAVVPSAGEIYINAEGKRVRRIKRASATPVKTGSADLSSILDTAAKRTGAVTVSGEQPSKEKKAAASGNDGEIYIRADGKKVRRVKKTKAAAAVGLITDKAQLAQMLQQPSAGTKIGAATVAGDQVTQKVEDGEIIIRADGKKVLRRKKTPVPEPDGTEVYRRADGKLVRRVKRVVTGAANDATSGLDQKLGADTSDRPKPTGAATVGGEVPVSTRLSVGESPPSLAAGFENVPSELDRSSIAGSTSIDENDTQSPSTAPQASASPISVEKPTASVAPSGPFVLGAGRAPATPSWMTKRASIKDVTPDPVSESSREPIYVDSGSPKGDDAQTTGATSEPSPSGDAPEVVSARIESSNENEQDTSSTALLPVSDSVAEMSASDSILTEDDEALAQFYRKKLKLGMPHDAVRHKMHQDGVADSIIAAVCGNSPSSLTPGSDSAVPEPSFIPTPTTGLSEDEESLVQFYRKKLKMGMSKDAVRHKMLQDAIAENVIVAVCGGDSPLPVLASNTASEAVRVPPPPSSLTEDEEALAQFYRKKLKLGMPLDAFRHKMLQDGAAENVVVAVCGRLDTPSPDALLSEPATIPEPHLSSTQSGLTEDDEALVQFYRKKLKMGMLVDAVRHKMLQDGVTDDVIAAVCGNPSTAAAALSVSPASTEIVPPELPSCSSGLTEDEEALAQFYHKKIKLGMPQDAVKHKMLQDGVADVIISAVCGSANAAALPQLPQVLVEPAAGLPATASSAPDTASDAAPSSVAYVVVVSDDPNLKLDRSPPATAGSLANLPKGPRVKVGSDERSLFSVLPTDKFEVKVSSDDSAGGNAEAATKFMTLDELSKLSGQSKAELEAMVVQRRENAEEPPKFVIQPQDVQPDEVLYPVSMMQKRGEFAGLPSPNGNQSANVPDGVSLPTMKPGEHLASIREDQEVVSSSLATAARAIAPLGDDITALLEKLQMGEMGALMQKLQEAEKRQKKLEKQLAGAGIQIAEDIDYSEALAKVGTIAQRMNEIGGSDVVREDKDEQNRLREEYFKLEQEMERYNTALMISEEYQAEQDRKEKEWETVNEPRNREALKMIRRHMPVNIRSMSEAELTGNPSPNGKFLPQAIAKKFKRTNVLQILRINPDDIERMHPSTLENMRVTGLTLTERRALYSHLRVLGPKWEKNKAEKMSERKWTWYQMMKNNFKENLAPYDRHVAQYGPPENHPYATREDPNAGCPLIGKQCPIKADLMPDYRNDYGWTDADEYEISNVTKSDADDPGAKAMAEARELAREKKANERADLLKKHYKGKLLQVSKANGSCESMDEAMDKMEFALIRWIEFKIEKGGPDQSDADKTKEIANFTETINEIKLMALDFAQRSGMQTSGKKKVGGDKPDIRSSVEASLSEEVIEMTKQFFELIRIRMKDLAIYDTRISKTIELLEGMFAELHDKNLGVLENLKTKRSDRSRKLRTIADIQKEVEEKRKVAAEETAEDSPASPPAGIPAGAPGRGGLMDGIKGRGGRGGLLDGIKGRGGGRGGLLDGIKGRGQAGGGGGRGGLMDAIQGRGRGSGPPGRGGFLDAIKGRGGGDGGGGRGGLMAAIAARGAG